MMRQTPFYEISVALKDRPKSFQLVVLSTFFLSLFFLLLTAGGYLPGKKEGTKNAIASDQKEERQTLINASSYAGKQ